MEWFEEWFNSPYYDLLYRNRDQDEARQFIQALIGWVELESSNQILDLACGKGRHSLILADAGFQVTGIDIASNNIVHARQFERSNLAFYQHDMRNLFRINFFDLILNLFTSFGYFESDALHLKTLKNIRLGLRPEGQFVLDFLNIRLVQDQLIPSEQREISGVEFSISRSIDQGFISKRIAVADKAFQGHYQEKVRAFSERDFEALFKAAGLQIKHKFGNYKLDEFEPESSPRLILIASK